MAYSGSFRVRRFSKAVIANPKGALANRKEGCNSSDKDISNKGIAEMGSHEELMARRGLYLQLYTAQVPTEAA